MCVMQNCTDGHPTQREEIPSVTLLGVVETLQQGKMQNFNLMSNDTLSPSLSPPSSYFLLRLLQVKPLLMVARQEEIFKAKEEELRAAVEKVKELEGKIKILEGKMATLSQEKKDLSLALAAVSLCHLHIVSSVDACVNKCYII